jgi:chromate transporter
MPSFKEAFRFWLKLGFISFGGPAGQIAIMHEHLVTRYKWISNSRFMHALNYCMLLPGPEAQQLATYLGWLLHGRIGGFAAGVLFVLPSMFILLALSMAYVLYGHVPWVLAMFEGLKTAVVAIVLLALVKIARRSLKSVAACVIAVAAFVAIQFLNVPFPWIVLSALALGAAMHFFGGRREEALMAAEMNDTANEEGWTVNSLSNAPGIGLSLRRSALDAAVIVGLWILPFVLFRVLRMDHTFWDQLSMFFTKAALVTFGGAYAVLPYVAQVSVEQLGWLTDLQMVDGLALGETTPGPLIMVLAYVGFMAAYHHHGLSLAMGSAGLLVTTWFTFLPCFLFIFVGAPLIERTRDNSFARSIMRPVGAAVVGVILHLAVFIGIAVLFPRDADAVEWRALAWTLVSLIAMGRMKVPMLAWLAVSAVYGLVMYWWW